jgi:hypothetical protein
MRQSSKEGIRKTANAKHILILTATANRQLSAGTIFSPFHSVRVFRWRRDYGTDQQKNTANFRGASKEDDVAKGVSAHARTEVLDNTQTADCGTFFGKTARGSRMLGLTLASVKSIYE